MSPTYRLVPDPAPLVAEGELLEPEVTLTEQEMAYLAEVDELEDPGLGEPSREGLADDGEWGLEDERELLEDQTELFDELADEAEDTTVDDVVERVAGALAGRGGPTREAELQAPRRRRWTTCFAADDAARTVRVYEENVDAAAADPPGQHVDRCSCIVMLNVGLGQLLSLSTRDHPARGFKSGMPRRPRRVQMGDLTTETIELAMAQLVRAGRATGPLRFDFTDRRGRRAGTLPPVVLASSVLAAVTARSPDEGCWYAFGLSLMDGFHSVLLLVDHMGASPRIYWLDQFTRGLTREVTTTLDAEITTFTQTSWQHVLNTKGKRFSTPIRLWPLRKRV
jgi:hypothetical protein